MKTFLTTLLFLVLVAVGWAQPPLQRGFFTTNVTAGGVPYNTIVVHGVTANPRVYTGSSGLTNAFYQLANGDTMLIGPGNYTNKSYYYSDLGVMPIKTTLLVNAKTNIQIIGYNSTFVSTNYGTMLSIHHSSNVTVQGIHFQGERADVLNYTNVALVINGALFTSGTNFNIKIKECDFVDLPNQAIAPLWGYVDGFKVEDCYGYNIGLTNMGAGGWGYPDGAFIAGLWKNAEFRNNWIEKVKKAAFEWDSAMIALGSAFQSDNVLIEGNTIIDHFGYALLVSPQTNKSLSNVRYIKNYHQRNAAGTWPNEMTDHVHADLYIMGVSNMVIQANHFLYGNALDDVIWLANQSNSVENVLIEGNTFRNNGSGSAAIFLDKHPTVNTIARDVVIRNNLFSSTISRFVDCSMPFVTIEGNILSEWGPGCSAIWLDGISLGGYGGAASNVVIRGNTFGSYGVPASSAWVLTMYGGATNKNVVFFDNYVNPLLSSNYAFYVGGPGTAIEWTLGSNILYRGYGVGAPTNAYGAGSKYFRTDTSTTGTDWIQTNSMGLPGWVPLNIVPDPLNLTAANITTAIVTNLYGNGSNLTNANGGIYLNAVTDTNAWGYDGIVDMNKTCQITNLGGAITIAGPTNGPAAGKVKAVRFYIIGDGTSRLVTIPASWKNKNASATLFYVTNGWTAVCSLEVVGSLMTNFAYVLDQ